MIYFAYGSNLHKRQMRRRCRKAKPLCKTVIHDWRMVFRGVCDVEPHPGGIVHGALWRITDDCERALDRYEGFPRLYIKRDFKVRVNGRLEYGIFYVMRNERAIYSPSPFYYEAVKQGYRDWSLPKAALRESLEHAESECGRSMGWFMEPEPQQMGVIVDWSGAPPGESEEYEAIDNDDKVFLNELWGTGGRK